MATHNAAIFGYDVTRKLMGHDSRLKTLEVSWSDTPLFLNYTVFCRQDPEPLCLQGVYDMSASNVSLTAGVMCETPLPLNEKLGYYLYIQADARRAAAVFTLPDAINADAECDLYLWYIAELCHTLLTGSNEWKKLPLFAMETALSGATISARTTLRKLLLRYRT